MPKWWRIGFVTLLIVTVSAQLTHWILQDPSITGENETAKVAYHDTYDLPWKWATKNLDCQQFERCVKIVVDHTDSCDSQLAIDVSISDIKDNWVDNVSMIVDSPKASLPSTIEVGVNRTDFVYFLVGAVTCTTGLPNEQATL